MTLEQAHEFGYMMLNAHKLAGGRIYTNDQGDMVYDPKNQVHEIVMAAEAVVSDCESVKGQRATGMRTIETLGWLATAFEHHLGLRPSASERSLFYRCATLALEELALPAQDIRQQIKKAVKQKPQHLVQFSQRSK